MECRKGANMINKDKSFLEVLKENAEKKEKELETLKSAIQIVESDNNWNIIMKAHSLI